MAEPLRTTKGGRPTSLSVDTRDRLFLALPYPLKVLAAGLQGRRLARDRYGRGAEQLVAEALDAERWSPERMLGEQAVRHRAVLARAARDVPYYRSWFATHRDRDPEVPTDWPVLAKREVQRAAGTLRSTAVAGRLVHDSTSGTTGTPLALTVSLEALRQWYGLYEARARRWHGVSRQDRWAILGGKMVARVGRRRPPHWLWSPTLHQLYLPANCLRSDTTATMLAALVRFGPTHLVGYPSSLAYLARTALDAGLAAPPLRVVIANAEPVTQQQRSVIEAFFGCAVRETYGMAEMVLGASECEAGSLHLWPEAGVLEVLDDHDRPVAPGGVGRFVVTGLLNPAMPLIRYDVGDRGRGLVSSVPCGCGRSLPSLGAIEGRSQDLIRTPTGEQVFWINPIFHGLPVVEAQVVQQTERRLQVRVVPGPSFDDAVAETIERRLRRRVGGMEITVSEVDAIARGPGGKFRPVLSLPEKAPSPSVESSEEARAIGEVEDDERGGEP